MKQLKTVLKFEFLNYAKAKSFIVTTLILMLVVALVLSWPRFFGGGGGQNDGDGAVEATEARPVALYDAQGHTEEAAAYYNPQLQDLGYRLQPVQLDNPSPEALEALVDAGSFEAGIWLEGPLAYTRFVRNTDMYDNFGYMFDELMLARYRADTLASLGVPADEIASFVAAGVQSQLVTTASGKDGAQNFLYTYILIMMLYMTIVLYGNMVASSVATEKSTRAMELLITAAKPSSLMFGKVLGAGLAGLSQFVLVLGTAFLCYNINIQYFADNPIIHSIFSMPLSLMLYTFLFYILGFFIYAFLYAALASLVSRMEDLSHAVQPVVLVLIAAFMVVIFSISSGQVNNPLIVACSFIPLTSPMAMFASIAMSTVPAWQVALSVGLLIASTIGIGYLAAAVYRLGVLLYGNRPKPGEVVRMLKANKQKA